MVTVSGLIAWQMTLSEAAESVRPVTGEMRQLPHT